MNVAWWSGWPVAATIANVRPWNESIAEITSYAPFRFTFPCLRAIFIAASFASAPLFWKNTSSKHEFSTSICASSTCGIV